MCIDRLLHEIGHFCHITVAVRADHIVDLRVDRHVLIGRYRVIDILVNPVAILIIVCISDVVGCTEIRLIRTVKVHLRSRLALCKTVLIVIDIECREL